MAIVTLIESLIQAGVALAPLLQGLLTTRAQISTASPNRPDVDDATMAALEQAIQMVQDKIDAAAQA